MANVFPTGKSNLSKKVPEMTLMKILVLVVVRVTTHLNFAVARVQNGMPTLGLGQLCKLLPWSKIETRPHQKLQATILLLS